MQFQYSRCGGATLSTEKKLKKPTGVLIEIDMALLPKGT
jgi:hypothetical protein